MSDTILDIRGLHKRFDDPDWVVDDISLSVRRGELLYVLGPSGSGKTTLLRLICGLEAPDRGEIARGGHLLSRPGLLVPPEQRRIGMVFQDYAIFPHLTVRANVQFGLRRLPWSNWFGPAGEVKAGPTATWLAALMALTGLTGLEHRYPHELSGGQQQRVALARAMAVRPDLILLDEPFSNLDAALRHRIRDEVREVLQKAGATSILVTHDQEDAMSLGDRIAVINEGRLEQVGTPDELLHEPSSRFVATFIGLSGFIPGQVRDGRLATELGTMLLPAEAAPPSAGKVDVLLRPDHIALAGNGHGTAARVVATTYQGVQTLYTLALPSGATVQAFFPGHPHLAIGDTTAITFDPPKVVVFPAE